MSFNKGPSGFAMREKITGKINRRPVENNILFLISKFMSSNGLGNIIYLFLFFPLSEAPFLFEIYKSEFHMLIAELNCELKFRGKMARVKKASYFNIQGYPGLRITRLT